MITSVKLVDGTDEFKFQDPSFGNDDSIVWTELTISSPEIRGSVNPRVSGDGSVDRTKWHGARSVSLSARVAGNPAAKVDALSRFLHPSRRPYLVMTDTDWNPVSRRMQLRVSDWDLQSLTNTSSWFRDIQLQWTAPAGVWESFETLGFNIPVAAGSTGRIYPETFPKVYEVTGSPGLVQFTNPGNGLSEWVARLYGPCNGPRLTDDITGETLAFFESLSLGAGQYVELSSADLTAYANSDTSLSRLHLMDFAQSQWWKVKPGANRIRYNPVSGVDAGCAAWFEFRPTWL